ncbi:hypothetical protein CR532_03225 [Candidatus Borreliella tachyglossi]|uniref:Uncharacterized protein n=1 Tax=Candidatus Borreliella tachyglossi TaxID=1964448 RepID=A0A2S1LXE8_9SPIR|nr:hypothetical protein [Candidatus Borreliella tachyglossi]AWG42974.1 hypothetical protein CR532_03225 [Candidatus Borreliella tachyglossi]
MLQSHVFVKKCKKHISQDESLMNTLKKIESVFYDVLKIFNKKSLEYVFNYYYENFDFDEGIYVFVDRFVPIINFLSLESLDYGFSLDEKKLILEVFDSSAQTFESNKLSELGSAIVSLGILD